jgi:O-antigen/teichoic acid export membrane protein
VGAQTVAVVAVGLVVNTLLARLLTPADFGLVALGAAIVAAGTLITSGGVAPTLIVRAQPPSAAEQAAVAGVGLAITVGLAVASAAVAIPLGGTDGAVVALMVASLPLYALRVPAAIELERAMSYGPVARAELVEALAFYAFALASVAAGLGVWGFAAAAIVRAATGSTLLVRASHARLPRPSADWRAIRTLLAPGLAYQGTTVVRFAREQGLNVGVAAIAGLGALGVWSLAYRVLQVPYLMFRVLWRVSFPAMGRLLASGADPRPAIEGSARVVATATGLVLCPLAGGAHALLPPLLGPGWGEVPDVVVIASAGIAAAAPQSVAVVGYLMAAGAARAILVSSIAQAAVWLAVGLALLAPLGVVAIGIGWLASSAVGVLTLGIPARRRSGARLVGVIGPPLALTLLGIGAGYLVGTAGDPSVPLGLAAAAAGLAAFLGALALVARPALAQTARIAREAVRGAASTAAA